MLNNGSKLKHTMGSKENKLLFLSFIIFASLVLFFVPEAARANELLDAVNEKLGEKPSEILESLQFYSYLLAAIVAVVYCLVLIVVNDKAAILKKIGWVVGSVVLTGSIGVIIEYVKVV